jgi:hypothetical protein
MAPSDETEVGVSPPLVTAPIHGRDTGGALVDRQTCGKGRGPNETFERLGSSRTAA